MALPTSGQISFADLQTEYGGSNPISMSEFRAQFANTSTNDSGPPYSIRLVSFNSGNNKILFNSAETTGIYLNNDMTSTVLSSL